MVLAQHSNTLIHLIRILFTVIDRVVYWALMQVYDLIDQISRVNLFGEGTLSEFSNRIYMIIGVLMLFKLAFSIINYIVDPDKLADSKKGFAGIVKNIAIMLVLIVTVPLIFKYAMALQYVIVSDNTIGRLITGVEGATTTHVGDNMSVAILSGFIHPDSGVKEGCENWSQECEDALKKYNLDQTYHNAYFSERGYNYLLELAQSTEEMGDGNFVITYNVILSTLVGAFTTWILLIFCIDLAVRIVKLGFLQLIAPIPIVTYMDDGGQGVFKKWVKTCTSTYADLFVRLAAINFAIYVISVFLISGEGNNTLTGNFKICKWSFDGSVLTADCNEQANFFIKLFLILGTLMFAKQLPKLIEDITGLKLDGKFTLNPMKKISDEALGGKLISRGLGLAGRTAGNIAGGLGAMGLVGGRALANKTGLDNKWAGFKDKMAHSKAGQAYSDVRKFAGKVDEMSGYRFGMIGSDVKNFASRNPDDYKKGREALKTLNKQEELGKRLYERYGGSLPVTAFKHQSYRDSYSKVDAAKKDMYSKRDALTAAKAQLNSAYATGDSELIKKAQAAVTNAETAFGKSQGVLDEAKRKHDILKGMYKEDANIEAAFDAYDKKHKTVADANIDIMSNATPSPSSSSTSSAPSRQTSTADVDPFEMMSENQSQRYNPGPTRDDAMNAADATGDMYQDIFDQQRNS